MENWTIVLWLLVVLKSTIADFFYLFITAETSYDTILMLFPFKIIYKVVSKQLTTPLVRSNISTKLGLHKLATCEKYSI